MDMKGTYLNGTLTELVYMWQPDGYNNRTGRVCHLKKTLYGLKPAGREWNSVLGSRMRMLGFRLLISDPCVYVQRRSINLEIMTVWVNDVLLFANAQEVMVKQQRELKGTFELTDIGEPSKIISIEIMQ